ncbi:hypothetical protein K435DRAFT_877786 [Dendrothele bispora CBS 962.96]|uniref:Reverse transcriptase/retrotransposon-derived protein RNase H-like domain-containing protein n=1 Tax=Dendrothele bispora (strain CBS 962.96) TaxID=1314807 RepID=A0A4S8KPK9_DENBC|nr:hypothetical protein K435DRAFT_877786 [Dendrothele bispora CBS 962.96]
MSSPLNKLTGHVPWEWGEIQQKAFEQIKEALANAPPLKAINYDDEKGIVLAVDTSYIAKNAAAGKAGGTTRTIATTRASTQAQQDEYARKKTRIFNGSVSNFNPPTTEPIETPQELVQKTNVGVFMDYNRLPDESLNALQNYLRAELLSVAHQVHFLTSHYRSTYDHLVSVIQTKLGRTEIEGGTSTVSQDPALQGLAPSASVVATQVDSTTVDNQAAIEVDNNADDA